MFRVFSKVRNTGDSLVKLIKSIKPVNPKGKYSSIFIGRTGAETETPIFWPPDMKI